jgi:hypothetical protein
MLPLLFVKLSFILLVLSMSSPSGAHPVIYKGGVAISSSNRPSFSDNYIMYSPTQHWALGANHWRFTLEDNQHRELSLLKLNHLLWRKNGEDFQSNIYLHAGGGVAQGERSGRAFMGGGEVDAETRSLFFSLKHYRFLGPGGMNTPLTQGRVGISPKKTDYHQLQSWVMVEAMHMGEINPTLMITPLLRFFYHNVMWEMGSSTRGEWMLNLMVHY